jgi:hypothetical protein
LIRFGERFDLSLRRKSNGKTMSFIERLPYIIRWLARRMRENNVVHENRETFGVLSQKAVVIDPKWGRHLNVRTNTDYVS